MELEKYPLTPAAKESLNLLLWDVSDRIGSDCVNFVAGLRPEVQSDVANALWLFASAMRKLPDELRQVRGTAWALMVLIKEQHCHKDSKHYVFINSIRSII